MTALVRYEAARAALQAAHDVDEVKDIRDKAQAMAAYAKQAQDTALVMWASEIKVRAERKAGEMLAEMKVNGSRAKATDNLKAGPKSPEVTSGTTLDSIGVSKKQASTWQKVAAIPEEKFEKAVAATKESAGVVTTAAVLRTATKPKRAATEKAAAAPKEKKPAADVAKLQARIKDLEEGNSNLADTCRELQDKLEAFEATEPDEQQKKMMSLQKALQRKDGEIERLNARLRDANNKNNELIREVKRLRRTK